MDSSRVPLACLAIGAALAFSPAPAAALDCTGPTLACNGALAGDTAGGSSLEQRYGLLTTVYDGPERVYRFDNPVPQTVSFVLRAPSDARLDLLLLGACDPTQVVDSGDESLIEPNLPAGSYFLVVDGREGASGSFELHVLCGSPRLEPTDLSASLAPGECLTEHKTLYFPPAVAQADVVFSFDLSGSMDQELGQMKANARQIYTELNRLIPSLQFGLASFVEYPVRLIDTVCGIFHIPTAPGGYPYRLHQPLTADIDQVEMVLQTLAIIGGARETYTRTFHESYTDPNIGWRDCTRRLWVDFGDEVPQDCNVYQCIGLSRNTGRDPGLDLAFGTADDLLLLDVLDAMRGKGINLIQIYSGRSALERDMWQCLAERTGGQSFAINPDGTIPDGTDVVGALVGVIKDTLRRCPAVALVPTGAQAGWVMVDPPLVADVLTPWVGDFQVTFCVPPGTAPGSYSIPIEARCLGAGDCAFELLGTQSVTIDVDPCRPPPAARAAAGPAAVCAGDEVLLDGGASTACGPDGLDYRWLDGASEVCGWSTDPTCPVRPPATTTYTLEVRCRNQPAECSAADPVTVAVTPVPAAALAPLPLACQGAEATLDASASDPAGCPAPLDFQFRQGATVLRPWSAAATHGPFAATVSAAYQVDVRCVADATCQASAGRDLTVVPPPRAEAGPDQLACQHDRVTLDGGGSVSSCPGGLLFEWHRGTTVVRPASPDPLWSPPTDTVGTITYQLVASCAGLPGCGAADPVTVTVAPCTLAVRFSAFRAEPADGAVRVSWSTAAEEGTLAFVVERSSRADGPWRPVGQATARGGGDYAWVDREADAAGRPWYRVVELTDHGQGDRTAAFRTVATGAARGRAGGRRRGR